MVVSNFDIQYARIGAWVQNGCILIASGEHESANWISIIIERAANAITHLFADARHPLFWQLEFQWPLELCALLYKNLFYQLIALQLKIIENPTTVFSSLHFCWCHGVIALVKRREKWNSTLADDWLCEWMERKWKINKGGSRLRLLWASRGESTSFRDEKAKGLYEFHRTMLSNWVKYNSAHRDELLEDVSHEHLRNNSKKIGWSSRAICHYGPEVKKRSMNNGAADFYFERRSAPDYW